MVPTSPSHDDGTMNEPRTNEDETLQRDDAGQPTTGPETASGNAPRQLQRGRDRKIAGVCSGLGDYLGVDPVLVRLLFVLGAVMGGSTVLLYVAGWVLMPEPPSPVASPMPWASDAASPPQAPDAAA